MFSREGTVARQWLRMKPSPMQRHYLEGNYLQHSRGFLKRKYILFTSFQEYTVQAELKDLDQRGR